MKKCSCCGKEKPLSDFGIRNRKTKEGIHKAYNCYCKICNSERSKQWYHNIKEKELKFVYRLVNSKNEIVYVGKTENLSTRFKQHFSKNGHLVSKFEKGENLKLQYISMRSTALMEIKEIYYINLYKPKYNTIYTNDEPSIFISDFKSDIWVDYLTGERIEDKNKNKTNVDNDLIDIKTVFKRKRGYRYCVYVEGKGIYGKNKQILKGSFVDEVEANSLVEKIRSDVGLS